jgi:alanyl-tRNA synthetase
VAQPDARPAHTAEHIFIRALQARRPTLQVRKVEHLEEGHRVFLKCDPLDWTTLHQAVLEANRIIWEGRPVREHRFPNLEAARERFPRLRAMEHRLAGKEAIRVVEVEGYDWAACAREHVANTRECGFLVVTRFVRARGGLYEIDFAVGEPGMEQALEYVRAFMETVEALAAQPRTAVKTALNLRREAQALRQQLRTLGDQLLQHLKPQEVKGRQLYEAVLEGVEAEWLMDRAGRLARRGGVVLLATRNEERAVVVLTRGEGIPVACGPLLKEVLGELGGKGGGREAFASGMVPAIRVEEALTRLRERVEATLRGAPPPGGGG